MNKILKYRILTIMITAILLFLSGCHVISQQLREQVKPETSFHDVLQDPERFKGQMIIVSGVIIETTNTKEGTLIKVLQRPAGFRGQPKDTDITEGRFLAQDKRFLDPAVYTKDREVTLAGEIQGKRILPTGEMEYTYPVIQVKELHLWPVIKHTDHNFYYDSFYSPFWRGYPTYIIVRHRCNKNIDQSMLQKYSHTGLDNKQKAIQALTDHVLYINTKTSLAITQ